VANRLVRHLRDAAALPLDGLRSVAGRRNINWTPDFMGFGNQLYLWCWAHAASAERPHRMVLMTDRMRYWADRVPEFARERIIERGAVSLLDRRGLYWAEKEKYSGDPRGFTDEHLERFVGEVLLPSPLLTGIDSTPYTSDSVIVVNVRRGDYYSDWFRPEHGMDVEGYLRVAVPATIAQDGPAERIHVISDDVAWCRYRLGWIADHARLTFASPDEGPASNFLDLCSARRLVVTNSSFSLWAGLVSTSVHRDNHRQIWAPAFFQRRYGAGRCFEYDQRWSFVDELPGGFQPDWLMDGRPHSGR
jgi:hypothetical protein